MGTPRNSPGAIIAKGLLTTAIALTIVPLITNILFIFAGTFRVADPNRSGAHLVGLSSLSMASVRTPRPHLTNLTNPPFSVQFNGILPSNSTPPSYLVTLHLFPSAFTWSYPSSPSPSLTSGILSSGATPADPFVSLKLLAARLPFVPSADTACLSDRTDSCSPFWTAVQKTTSSPFRFQLSGPFASKLARATHIMAVVVILFVLVSEACIAYSPGSMRCQCWWRWYARMCPLPKGSKEEVAALPGRTWDRVRLWMYGIVVPYCWVPVQHGMGVGYFFVRALEDFEGEIAEGAVVDASMGRGYLIVGWGGVVCSVVAMGCVMGRFWLTRGGGEEGEEGVGLLAEGEVLIGV